MVPVPVGNDLFDDLTQTIGEVDFQLQMPLFKGLGLGVGGKGTFFTLDERALLSAISGDVQRWTYYGKVQYERYTGPSNFYEFAAKAGQSRYIWNASTCPEPTEETGFHWGAAFTYYLHATENLAFGLLLGYETDDASVGPQTLCQESFPGRPETTPEGPISYFTVGLCFHTVFTRAPDRPMGTF